MLYACADSLSPTRSYPKVGHINHKVTQERYIITNINLQRSREYKVLFS